MRGSQLISVQARLRCSLPQSILCYGPFRRRYRCAPVHRETGEMVAILIWCAPAFGFLLLARGRAGPYRRP